MFTIHFIPVTVLGYEWVEKRMNSFAPKVLEKREKVDCLKRTVLNYRFSFEI